jgi:hypothetical protein
MIPVCSVSHTQGEADFAALYQSLAIAVSSLCATATPVYASMQTGVQPPLTVLGKVFKSQANIQLLLLTPTREKYNCPMCQAELGSWSSVLPQHSCTSQRFGVAKNSHMYLYTSLFSVSANILNKDKK